MTEDLISLRPKAGNTHHPTKKPGPKPKPKPNRTAIFPLTQQQQQQQQQGQKQKSEESENSHVINIQDIAPDGDVVLHIEHDVTFSGPQTQTQTGEVRGHRFRISSEALQTRSRYFARLFQGRFGEREQIARRHEELRVRYGNLSPDIPSAELPVVHIDHLGRIAPVKSLAPLCADLLAILHGHDLPQHPPHHPPPVANLANLAIVADRFDALPALRAYCVRTKIFRAIEGKTTPSADASLSQERVRQRLLLALLLDHPPWLESYSRRLILKGWTSASASSSDISALPLWWDLPSRLECELAFRRARALETLQSLLTQLLESYLSPRTRQCRLGYDSSAQCDSFQLGEAVRFLVRVQALRLKGTLFSEDSVTFASASAGAGTSGSGVFPAESQQDHGEDGGVDGEDEEEEAYTGDILTFIDSLRRVPEYQIDRNHSHCGLRTRLIPLLDFYVEVLALVGVCASPSNPPGLSPASNPIAIDHPWIDALRPLTWKRSPALGARAAAVGKGRGGRRGKEGDEDGEAEVRAEIRRMFLAGERDWVA